MRLVVVVALLACCACGPPLEVNLSKEMTPDQMADRATHIFIGEILQHRVESWPFLRIPGEPFSIQGIGKWMVLVRDVKVDMLIRGSEERTVIPIHEIFWTGGTMGNWNSTRNQERYLFLVRREGHRYHVVRDYWRSIFPYYGGNHKRLPLSDRSPILERFALLNHLPGRGYARGFGDPYRSDPGLALSEWRRAKLQRGLLRHPDRRVQLRACEALLFLQMAQDECWERFSPEERRTLNHFHNVLDPVREFEANRRFELDPMSRWKMELRQWSWSPDGQKSMLRLFTTIRKPSLRAHFCREFLKLYPSDTDNGCPPDRPPPATIVTMDGDVPLTGEWPTDH
jgi:hypothetical protein